MIIQDILNAKGHQVETIWPERLLTDAVTLFNERGISSLVVTDHSGAPIGLATDRDVLRTIAQRGRDALDLRIHAVMQSPPPSCRIDDPVTRIMHRMTQDRIRHVVVIRDGKVLGIVSIGDLLKSRLHDADLENKVLRERALSRLASE